MTDAVAAPPSTWQHGADAAESAVQRLSQLLLHDDDISSSRLQLLRRKLLNERTACDTQLAASVTAQLDETLAAVQLIESSIDLLDQCKTNHATVVQLCERVQQLIDNDTFIRLVSRVHQHALETKQMYERFKELDSELERVAELLRADCPNGKPQGHHVLVIHYHLVKLEQLRASTLHQLTAGGLAEIESILGRFFQKLDRLAGAFEEYFFSLCQSLLDKVVQVPFDFQSYQSQEENNEKEGNEIVPMDKRYRAEPESDPEDVNTRASLVVRLMTIIEYEERMDANAALVQQQQQTVSKSSRLGPQGSLASLTSQSSQKDLALMNRITKGYRTRFMNCLHESIEQRFQIRLSESSVQQLQDGVLEALRVAHFVVDELQWVRDQVEKCCPISYKIFDFFVLEYHRHVYLFIQSLLKPVPVNPSGKKNANVPALSLEPQEILALVNWIQHYYEAMDKRLAVPRDLLEPRLLEGDSEALLCREYVAMTKQKMGSWVQTLLANETRAFQVRDTAPECDAETKSISPGITIDLFQIVRQHIAATARSARGGRLLVNVTLECIQILTDFAQNLTKAVELECKKVLDKSDSETASLEAYLIMMANSGVKAGDCVDAIQQLVEKEMVAETDDATPSNDLVLIREKMPSASETFMRLSKVCYTLYVDIVLRTVKPEFSKLFQAAWYAPDAAVMETICATYADFLGDCRETAADYVLDKIVGELMERHVLVSLEALRDKKTKFKAEQQCNEHLQSDIQCAISLFQQYGSQKRCHKAFSPLERAAALVAASREAIFLDFYTLWKHYPDVPLGFVEDVLNRRDDIKGVKEIMEQCKKKVKEEQRTDVSPSIFAKLNYK